MRRWMICIALVLFLLVSLLPVSAHALPVKIDPPLNTGLDQAPSEIRIWFSEPVEPQFSKILLRDANGNIVDTVPSSVSPTDPTELVLQPGNLPNGIYTVVWRVLSIADGHSTLGSFPLTIGAVTGGVSSTQSSNSVGVGDAIIRWANLLSLAMGVGGLAFLLFVWRLAVPEKYPRAESCQFALVWMGWVLIGISGFFLILLQYSVATGSPLFTGINSDSLNALVADTRFGHLWLARMALWAGMGGALWFGRTDSWFNWIALLIGAAILVINSVFSHANAAADQLAAVAADFMHLTAMVAWVGGLFQFINVIVTIRRDKQNSTVKLGHLVGHFSNFARVSVATLSITGLYLLWLDVGSFEALFSTLYGQTLIIKSLLFLPVMGIAAINLFYTHRGLQRGEAIWEGRLRNLVSVEISLTVGMLLAVGVMTSSYPSRVALDQRLANPPPPDPQPFTDTQTANDLTVQLTYSPGWIGNNDFTLKVTDSAGKPVNDVTLIRMKFESETKNLGESELRPTLTGDGVYTVSGENLSVPGVWRIRTTIQRPNQFDTLVDFKPDVPAIPEPPEAVPLPAPDAPLPYRVTALLLVGVAALAFGGFFLGENRTRPLRVSALLSVGLLGVGIVFLLTAVQGTNAATVSTAIPAFAPAPDAPIHMAVTSNVPLPFIVTNDGKLLQPGTDNQWHVLPLDAKVRDVYVDGQDVIWAATDSGVYTDQSGEWMQQSTLPVKHIDSMHGYIFALGDKGAITRVPAGGVELDHIRELQTPLTDQPTNDMVMLGDHSHIAQVGSQLFHTDDLGLSWKPLDAPQSVDSIAVDTEGNLLATNDSSLQIWNYVATSWGSSIPLPGGDAHPILQAFNDHLYALGAGGLYVLTGNKWHVIRLPGGDDAYLTALKFQYPTNLWVLDAKSARLWSSADGNDWTMRKIVVS